MREELKGKIIKGIAGFYYVHTGSEIYACRAAGIFRKLGLKPLPGDDVVFEVTDPKDQEGNILRIEDRRSELLRPAAANIDSVIVVLAVRDPDPSFLFTDRLLIALGTLGFKPQIFINKCDLDSEGMSGVISDIYLSAGYKVILGSAYSDETVTLVRDALRGHTTALAGASGVGKSTLVNRLIGSDVMEVGDISVRTGRGRQTTRHTELFFVEDDTFIMDTPGFSALTIEGVEPRDLKDFFTEFEPYEEACRYSDCSHVYEGEDLCAVRRAVSRGEIPLSRYESYIRIYNELKEEGYS